LNYDFELEKNEKGMTMIYKLESRMPKTKIQEIQDKEGR
jgi:hypothetical protein